MHRFSLLLLSFLGCLLLTKANTEIVNFQTTYSDNATLVEAVNWHTLSYGDPEQLYKVQPAPLNARWDKVCEPLAELSCPHEIWAVLDLDDDSWRAFFKFTLRISWPASSPADFSIQTFSPVELRQQLGRGDGPLPHADAHRKTRRRYARVRAVDTGIRNPLSQATAASTIPFALRLEPLYLGVIPASVVPTLLFLLPIVAFAALVMVPRIHRFIASVATDAREELARVHADGKED